MTGHRIGRQLSLATRRELIQAIAERYHAAGRSEKKQILGEFTKVTGYHRKHAIRAIGYTPCFSRLSISLSGCTTATVVACDASASWMPVLK